MLDLTGVRVAFGPVEVVRGVSLAVPAGSVLGIVGPNGAGKTSLLDAVSGAVPLAAGSVRLEGVEIGALPAHRRARSGLARTFQNLELFDDLTVSENLAVAARPTGVLPGHRAGAGPSRTRHGAPGESVEAGVRAAALSHGQRKAVALDRALAGRPRALLLDEPAAGLDGPAREALGARLRTLAASGLAVVVADHDVDLVLSVSAQVAVLDLGEVLALGPPESVRDDPRVVAAYLGTAGPRPRRAAPAPGATVLAASDLSAGYGGAPVVEGLDLAVRAGEVVALLGPNGAGKTSTLRALSGMLGATGDLDVLGAPALGVAPERLARRGLAHVPQDRAVLGDLTVAENVRLATGHPGALDRAFERFPPLAPLAGRRAGGLSGGEQQMLALARALARDPCVLLVDEPSLGLAPAAARLAVDAVRRAAEGGAGCVLAEQHPALALAVADRAVVLVRGRIAFEGPAAALAGDPERLRRAYLGGE